MAQMGMGKKEIPVQCHLFADFHSSFEWAEELLLPAIVMYIRLMMLGSLNCSVSTDEVQCSCHFSVAGTA
jgi:hypothetical protein